MQSISISSSICHDLKAFRLKNHNYEYLKDLQMLRPESFCYISPEVNLLQATCRYEAF